MPVVRIDDADDPRLADYRHVPDPELLRRGDLFVAEGRLVVRALLTASPFATRSLLLTESGLAALHDLLGPAHADLPVYVVPQSIVETLTRFNINRGCLAIGERPRPASLEALLARLPDVRTIVVLERVANADNVGAVFRNAAALGAEAVIFGPHCCDPLYRKAIRVSMGAALRIPFAHAGAWPHALDALTASGFVIVALSVSEGSASIDEFVGRWDRRSKLALLAGSEGEGLSPAACERAAVTVRIPMAAGNDSLNVATAVAIALHRLVSAA